MNSNKERRRITYNTLYKTYVNQRKKVVEQKNRMMLLKSSNKELYRELNRLKEEVRKSSTKNSNLKAEIYDIAMERKNVMLANTTVYEGNNSNLENSFQYLKNKNMQLKMNYENNKHLYDTLASLHQDALSIEQRLDSILCDKTYETKFYDSQSSFSIPDTRTNTVLPENNYLRYNFKDCIYVQDLSPIMEENSEEKKLNKPPEITRRLGHRAKVPQPYIAPGNYEANETNDIAANGSEISTPCLSEQLVGDLPNDKEASAKISESPIVTINLVSTPPDNEDFRPSIFVNVFPRRKKVNEHGCSLAIGGIDEEECDSENNQEPNSTYNEKEDSIQKKCSSAFSKSLVEQTISEEHQNNSMLNCNKIIAESSSKISVERTFLRENLDTSSLEPSIIEGSDESKEVSVISTEERTLIKETLNTSLSEPSIIESSDQSNEVSRLSASKAEQSSSSKQGSTSKLSKDEKMELKDKIPKTSKRNSTESSVSECSPCKKGSPISSKGKKKEDEVSCRSSGRSSVRSSKADISDIKVTPSTPKQSIDNDNRNSTKRVLRLPTRSLKATEKSFKKDSKISLRLKKPINFVESPMATKKRHKRKKKTVQT